MIASWATFAIAMIVVFATSHADKSIPNTCDSNEKYLVCAQDLSCQPSCKTPSGNPCPRMCGSPPCECKDGFIRDNNLKCIPVDQCEAGTARLAIICGENEKPAQCPSLQTCQPSCEEPAGGVCPRLCSLSSCECVEGFVRVSSTNSTCVEKSQCPEIQLSTPATCGANEIFDSCADPCPPTCGEPNPTPCLAIRCSPGCVCAQGFFRQNNSIDSPCVTCS